MRRERVNVRLGIGLRKLAVVVGGAKLALTLSFLLSMFVLEDKDDVVRREARLGDESVEESSRSSSVISES